MRVGAIFPQWEIGKDPAIIRNYVQAIEGFGYDHLLIYDHVLGASASSTEKQGYTNESPMHEPLVLLGYIAALTQHLELVTGILILPQRQTALVAKQAAEIDFLTGGRLRLGVGIGWNKVEYQGLNEDFGTRGARLDEQIELLRAFWTQPAVTFNGRWHQIEGVGINPLPVQRPIPLWCGGESEPALRRAARTADGWIALGAPDDEHRRIVERLTSYRSEAGHAAQNLGIEAQIIIRDGDEDGAIAQAAGWKALGATHVCIGTGEAGYSTAQQHIDALGRIKKALQTL